MIQTLRKLWQIHGGLHLDYHKEASNNSHARNVPLAAEFIIPLQQHAGYKPTLTAKVGDYVYKGQELASHTGFMKVPVHASTSGTITAIEERPIAHPSGLKDLCLILTPDGKDDWGNARMSPYPDPQQIDPETLRKRICAAGIVGMGGAVFPSAIKLNVHDHIPVESLIINGAECEPYITCDDRLMQEQPEEIIGGIQIMMHIINAPQCLIGIEDNKPQAIAALQTALEKLGETRVQVIAVPTLYPTGSEKQLIQILTGKEVPSGGRPANIGIVCHNPATARAIYRAIRCGEPLIDRYVTVTGEGITQPANFNVPLGTPIAHLVQHAGGYAQPDPQLAMGGPMMGVKLPSDQIPIVKATNCILITRPADTTPTVMPCIRCGRCAQSCPASLLPQQLYWHARAREFEKAENYHLFDCIECGCCAYVCPSHIPLVDYYRFAKAEIRTQRDAKNKAERARERHDFHQERLERAKREKAEKLAKHKQQAQTGNADDSKQAAIQAALERAKAKKAQTATTASSDAPVTTSENAPE
ncbi:MAG: electron transport complex subunit RsxC [Thiothrix lacustris]|uniref:Ion-translocating oxidoreductase complex subunit C n=1 Tax=Thiothrix lacustris TaxID=525917 RepID=A0A1Y1QM48_9GAMM|nr:MAG: electron transport complex subunit RsxC [Thiothrix lacustris]